VTEFVLRHGELQQQESGNLDEIRVIGLLVNIAGERLWKPKLEKNLVNTEGKSWRVGS